MTGPGDRVPISAAARQLARALEGRDWYRRTTVAGTRIRVTGEGEARPLEVPDWYGGHPVEWRTVAATRPNPAGGVSG